MHKKLSGPVERLNKYFERIQSISKYTKHTLIISKTDEYMGARLRDTRPWMKCHTVRHERITGS